MHEVEGFAKKIEIKLILFIELNFRIRTYILNN